MPRNTSGLLKGGPGRKKGEPNKATAEVREAARKLVEDETYREKLLARLKLGKTSPAVEAMLRHYAYGKPKEIIGVEGGDGLPLTFTIRVKDDSADS